MTKNEILDNRKTFFETATGLSIGTEYSVNDVEAQFYATELGLSDLSAGITQMRHDFPLDKGFSNWDEYLRSLGFTGDSNDLLDSWYNAGYGIQQQYGTASVLYSLQNISGNETDIIRVRRDSDDAERSFSASELRGSMIDWVNETVVLNDSVLDWGADSARTEYLSSTTFGADGQLLTGASTFVTISTVGGTASAVTYEPSVSTSSWVFDSTYSNFDEGMLVRINSLRYRKPSGSSVTDLILKGDNNNILATIDVSSVAEDQWLTLSDLDLRYTQNITSPSNLRLASDGPIIFDPDIEYSIIEANATVSQWYDQRVPTSNQGMYWSGVGTDDVVTIPTTNIGTVHTIEFTARVDTSSSSHHFLYAGGSSRIYIANNVLNYQTAGAGDETRWDVSQEGTHTYRIVRNGTTVQLFYDGVEQTPTLTQTNNNSYTIRRLGTKDGATVINDLQGTMYNVSIDIGNTGTNDHEWIGLGNLNENWVDQVGSLNGVVSGDPDRTILTEKIVSHDLVQSTLSNQPIIVDAGALFTVNNNPAMRYVNNTSQLRSNVFAEGSNVSLFIVVNNEAADTQRKIFIQKNSFPNSGFTFNYRGDQLASRYDFITFTGSGQNLQYNDATSPNLFLGSLFNNGSSKEAFVNSNSVASDTDAYVESPASSIILGTSTGLTDSFSLQELVLFGADKTSDRVAIENNINNRWRVY